QLSIEMAQHPCGGAALVETGADVLRVIVKVDGPEAAFLEERPHRHSGTLGNVNEDHLVSFGDHRCFAAVPCIGYDACRARGPSGPYEDVLVAEHPVRMVALDELAGDLLHAVDAVDVLRLEHRTEDACVWRHERRPPTERRVGPEDRAGKVQPEEVFEPVED